eukprot:CAMPEP_0177781582 /NCGR_PEP_ID=MMETSP0491_2-20121128/17944_1 /TAXON_ID=63592 /ORGANISM="Tetraselmis chuii, Strain PLY429" /LENGTH=93 /DNA_ID=CAMNT_0019301691 /DNA_START=322 /DNA_END=603 /DNA_ORIENTATION=-
MAAIILGEGSLMPGSLTQRGAWPQFASGASIGSSRCRFLRCLFTWKAFESNSSMQRMFMVKARRPRALLQKMAFSCSRAAGTLPCATCAFARR